MNNNDQAQKGFQTFVLTLSISLIVFSVIYYFVTISSEDSTLSPNVAEKEVTRVEDKVSVRGKDSVFKKLASTDAEESQTASGMVLAVGDTLDDGVLPEDTEDTTTPESTTSVPDTGTLEVTVGLFGSLVFFALALSVLFAGPRKLAISRFESKFLRD